MTIRKKTLFLTGALLLTSLAADFITARAFYQENPAIATYSLTADMVNGFILSAAILFILSRIVLTPLERLNRQLAAIGSGGETGAVELPGGEELDNLARTINETMGSLRVSEERYRNLVEHQLDLVCRWEPDGRLTYVNGPFYALFHRNPEELLGLSWKQLGADQPIEIRELSRDTAPAPSQVHTVERQITLRDGRRLWFEWSNTPLHDKDGRLLEIQSVGRDITDRKGFEAALRSSEERYRLFVENFPGIAFRLDFDLNFEFVHGAVEEITGYPREEFSSGRLRWDQIVHPEDLPLLTGERELFRTIPGFSATHDYRIIRKDGTIRQLHAIRQGIDADGSGRPGGIQGVTYDITDKVRAQQELHAAKEEAEQANRTKSEFLATISHELRTPLTAILGLAESLQEQAGGTLAEAQFRSLEIIETSGYHLLSLINDLLDLSRIEAGRMEFFPERVNLESLCRTCLRFMNGQATAKQITLSLDLHQVPDEITVDSRRLTQILTNLLSNAVKFTPAGGAAGIMAVADRGAGVVRFTVWDTGIGISPEAMETLFIPFKQVDGTLSRDYEGTGLGLALVSRMAELQGGGITVVSEVGSGSRFTVTLPLHPAAAPSLPEVPEPPSAPEPLQEVTPRTAHSEDTPLILLAEDNDTTREMTSEFLRGRGYRVDEARNGEEALERTSASQPDLIVMDVQMPGIDGLEAIRLIRNLPGILSTTPIIALTALAMAGDRERCLAAGATEYFSKPIRLRNLSDRIGVLLNQAPPRRS